MRSTGSCQRLPQRIPPAFRQKAFAARQFRPQKTPTSSTVIGSVYGEESVIRSTYSQTYSWQRPLEAICKLLRS